MMDELRDLEIEMGLTFSKLTHSDRAGRHLGRTHPGAPHPHAFSGQDEIGRRPGALRQRKGRVAVLENRRSDAGAPLRRWAIPAGHHPWPGEHHR